MENDNTFLLPLIPLRGMVMFPGMTFSFDIGRQKSLIAIDSVMNSDKLIFLPAQISDEIDSPSFNDLYKVGVIARIKQVMKLPSNACRIVAEGLYRGVATELVSVEPFFKAAVIKADDIYESDYTMNRAFERRLKSALDDYFTTAPRFSAEQYVRLMAVKDLSKLSDSAAAAIPFDNEVKQSILEAFDVYKRIELIITAVMNEIEILNVEKEISERVKEAIDENQREYYLREQLKVISDELDEKDGIGSDADEFRKKLVSLRLKKDISEKISKEIDRFSKMPPATADSNVLRNYIETVLELPWNKKTRERIDIKTASDILDRDHYGLEKVKERILEYLSVRQLTSNQGGPILCLVGPPGVGKTSIAKSIAEALNRKYTRISLGGIHDEADIRGHRKTYIGAMEGRIIAAVKQAGTKNPLILLDEVDKMGKDYRGDPASALLEVLDSDQNSSFRDHYIEVPFDLSDVLFLMTANTLDSIPRPLLDRMEVIEISGYTYEEKLQIASRYLIEKSKKKTGLSSIDLKITDEALEDLIKYYTREAGVRNLEREILHLCRKIAKEAVSEGKASFEITPESLTEYLGRHRYRHEAMNECDECGIARGLAWTQVGGETLSIEVNIMDGTGKIELTGQLGDVMKESAMAAISYIRSRADAFSLDKSFYKDKDIHIHVPEGAVPKDGPSAGITIATAVVSALTKIPVRRDVAMTGEITLRGRVLPIGGLKEKALAAYQVGIHTIIIPHENIPDLDDIPSAVRDKLEFIPVKSMDSVLETALTEKI